MINFINKKVIFYFLITLLIFTLDRISKIYVINIAENYGEVDIYLNQFINIILVWNTGIGFGLLSFEKQFFYNLITLIIVLVNFVILYLGIKLNNLKGLLFFVILGGSLGNLFDRLYYSAVPDFIDLNYKNFHWFIFNVADIFITLGIICLIFVELFSNKDKEKNEE
tara:strand:- start:2765 stop:3265 length:501 start_codon:yes stop_codon:yes gene_type:complete